MMYGFFPACFTLEDFNAGRAARAFSRRPAAISCRCLRGLPVLVYEVSRRVWGLRLRRTNQGSRYRPCPFCLPHILTPSASGLYLFPPQSPPPPLPLLTLHRPPRVAP